MERLLKSLRADFAAVQFVAGSRFAWSPATGQVMYDASARGATARWSLLHETAHALLKHDVFANDLALLAMERDAWQQATVLAKRYGCAVLDDHTQDCLDTYRDWLYRRSVCPTCGVQTAQVNGALYRCFNCLTAWRVAASRDCRAYRLNMQKTARS